MGEWRYLLIKLISDDKIQKQAFWSAFRNVLIQIFGEYGYMQVDPKLIDYDEENLKAILKCRKKGIEIIRASLLFLININSNPIMAYVARTSGTLKKLKSYSPLLKSETGSS
ncbi:MAG: Rpp14/Pop5 family protein [Candidatus Bathyarchaeia archaeon]